MVIFMGFSGFPMPCMFRALNPGPGWFSFPAQQPADKSADPAAENKKERHQNQPKNVYGSML
jgi:hypothetical protein